MRRGRGHGLAAAGGTEAEEGAEQRRDVTDALPAQAPGLAHRVPCPQGTGTILF